jgi:hypothetical protein
MSKKYLGTTTAESLDKVYRALVLDHKAPALTKVCRASYYLNQKYQKGVGMFSASYRLMWGSKEELAAKIEAAGFKVRTMGDSEFSVWVSFDVPAKFLKVE